MGVDFAQVSAKSENFYRRAKRYEKNSECQGARAKDSKQTVSPECRAPKSDSPKRREPKVDCPTRAPSAVRLFSKQADFLEFYSN